MGNSEVRYFLAAYGARSGFNTYTGSVWFPHPGFPRNIDIKEHAIRLNPEIKMKPEDIVVTNIFEFKSREDYNAFAYKPEVNPGAE